MVIVVTKKKNTKLIDSFTEDAKNAVDTGVFIDLVGRLLYCGQNFTESRGAWTFWFWRKMFQHCS